MLEELLDNCGSITSASSISRTLGRMTSLANLDTVSSWQLDPWSGCDGGKWDIAEVGIAPGRR